MYIQTTIIGVMVLSYLVGIHTIHVVIHLKILLSCLSFRVLDENLVGFGVAGIVGPRRLVPNLSTVDCLSRTAEYLIWRGGFWKAHNYV